MSLRLIATTGAALALALSACGGSDDAESTDAPAAETADDAESAPDADGADATITIADFAFGDPITVSPGTEVTVENVDGAPHSVTADTAGFTSGILDPGASGSFTAPDEAGTYTFFCAVHPSMTGELIVG